MAWNDQRLKQRMHRGDGREGDQNSSLYVPLRKDFRERVACGNFFVFPIYTLRSAIDRKTNQQDTNPTNIQPLPPWPHFFPSPIHLSFRNQPAPHINTKVIWQELPVRRKIPKQTLGARYYLRLIVSGLVLQGQPIRAKNCRGCMHCMYSIKSAVKNTVFYNNISYVYYRALAVRKAWHINTIFPGGYGQREFVFTWLARERERGRGDLHGIALACGVALGGIGGICGWYILLSLPSVVAAAAGL